MTNKGKLSEAEIKKTVAERFGKFGRTGASGFRPCCMKEIEFIRVEARYTKEQLALIPKEAIEVSAGCGNPLLLFPPKKKEIVLDLGCGGGIDVFLASTMVGPKGKAIGIDFAEGMIVRAKKTAKKHGYKNVEFILGDMEELPFKKESIDEVISNCVINLCPNKDRVFREIYRVLKPGGKLSISDTVSLGDLPPEVINNLNLWVGCISGAIDRDKYLEKIKEVGFINVKVKETHPYTTEGLMGLVGTAGADPQAQKRVEELLKRRDLPQIASSKYVAVKPAE